MADFNQFGSATTPQSADCAQCESMLADVLDGTLTPADQATFDLHVAGCPPCTSMLADARSGAAWLNQLKPHRPEPSADLLERIFAQTLGPQMTSEATQATSETAITPAYQANTLLGVPASASAAPIALSGKVLPFRQRLANAFRLDSVRHTLMQPRLAMTAAMAFFSIALTLNLTGVRLSQLRASDFTPSAIKRAFYNTNASVVRTFDNMRVVYELESRVRDLQRASDNETPAPAPSNQNTPAPSNQPSGDQSPGQKNDPNNPDHKQPSPHPKSGTSRRESPDGHLQYVGSLTGRGIPPAALHTFVVFTPGVHRHQQEGGLA